MVINYLETFLQSPSHIHTFVKGKHFFVLAMCRECSKYVTYRSKIPYPKLPRPDVLWNWGIWGGG